MKVTLITLTKIFLITPPETWVWEKNIKMSRSKFEFAGGVANGYKHSVVNITTAVVWIRSNWLIADNIHCTTLLNQTMLSITDS